jgi:type IV secretion system protein VirB4
LALAFVGASDKESIAEIRALEAKHGESWTDEWLVRRGLTLRDYGLYEEVTT